MSISKNLVSLRVKIHPNDVRSEVLVGLVVENLEGFIFSVIGLRGDLKIGCHGFTQAAPMRHCSFACIEEILSQVNLVAELECSKWIIKQSKSELALELKADA